MERILIRAGVAPWAEYNALDVITDKIIGNNTGNLLFANSITRLVATADSRVDFISDLTLVKKQITAQEINENYDRLILPMANAFREDFARKCLKHWTALIRQLTIPVTVTGIGIQLPYEPHLEQPREFDGAARDFIAAVLDRVSLHAELFHHGLRRAVGFRVYRSRVQRIPAACASRIASTVSGATL